MKNGWNELAAVEGWAYNVGSPGVVVYSIIHRVTNGADQSATVLAH
ncbi:MAG TPA: hypothetical protein VH325_07230 [Bryobacteraceae bacterium]|jgi:hypothetical protein|nr:hypothetical protein [Bryobacteraceae bacterium]